MGYPLKTRKRISLREMGWGHTFHDSTPEANLWGEVILRAIRDLWVYMAHRKDPKAHPLTANRRRRIVDGCDPERWIFAKNTGFFDVCQVLNVKPCRIRTLLREQLKEVLDVEPNYPEFA